MLEDILEDDPYLPPNMVQFFNGCIATSTLCPEKNIRPKVYGFVDDVISKMTSAEFRRHFRVTINMYEHLLRDLKPDLVKHYSGGKEPISPETHLLVFFWYVANQDSPREIGVLFGIGEWSVNTIIKHVVEVYVNVLMITLSYQMETVKRKLENHLKKVVGFLTLLVLWTELIFQFLTVLEEMQIMLTEKVTHQFSYNL